MTPVKRAWIILICLTLPEAVPLVIYTAQNGTRFLRFLGFAPGHFGAAPGWVLALAFAAVYAGFAILRSPFIKSHLLRLDAMKLFVLFVFAPVTGVFEELYFRKLLMNSVAAHGGAVLLQVLLSALVFGIIHGVWGIFGKSLRIAISATVATAILGAMMAFAYIAAGRSVAPCIVAHALINAAVEPWLILAAVSRSWRGLQPPTATPAT
jgi:hypothetical protein